MSAWARLVNWDGSDMFLELCLEALAEIQDETKHRIAERIRNAKVREPEGETEEHVNNVLDDLADEIDPKAKR